MSNNVWAGDPRKIENEIDKVFKPTNDPKDDVDLTLQEIIEKLTVWANHNGFVFDDIVDKDDFPYTLMNGYATSMYYKFKEDLLHFITGYKYNVKGTKRYKFEDK